jgi:hypothetical protein
LKRTSELFIGSLHGGKFYHIAGTNRERNQNHALRRVNHSAELKIPRTKRGQSSAFRSFSPTFPCFPRAGRYDRGTGIPRSQEDGHGVHSRLRGT